MIESLYRTHRPWLVQWCTAMTGDPVVAEDLVQDTFLRALEHLEDLEDLSVEGEMGVIRPGRWRG